MSYEEHELREFLATELLKAFGTAEPSETELSDLYARTQQELYPKRDGPAPLQNKEGRERMKVLRRGLELAYPWLRKDARIRTLERIRRPAYGVDIIKNTWNDDGFVVLRRAQVNGQDSMEQFTLIRAKEQQALLPNRHPPLDVLLVRLWHYEGVLDGSTPIRWFDAVQSDGGGGSTLRLRGSAISLEQFMGRL